MNLYDPASLDRRDPELIARVLPLLETFNARYLRFAAHGAEHVPRGPVIFVGNHNGGIMGPDLSCTLSLLWRRLGPHSPLFALAHDFAMRQLPPLGKHLQKFGALAASRSNAVRVLERGGQVLVYPGGDLDAYRHFNRRNRVVIFPRTGFVEVARATGAPIVPVVTHGAHRSAYIFAEGQALARLLGMPRWARLTRFPLALALPWGIAPGPWLPYLPLPFRVQSRVLPAVQVERGADACDLSRRIEASMQRVLDEMAT